MTAGELIARLQLVAPDRDVMLAYEDGCSPVSTEIAAAYTVHRPGRECVVYLDADRLALHDPGPFVRELAI